MDINPAGTTALCQKHMDSMLAIAQDCGREIARVLFDLQFCDGVLNPTGDEYYQALRVTHSFLCDHLRNALRDRVGAIMGSPKHPSSTSLAGWLKRLKS